MHGKMACATRCLGLGADLIHHGDRYYDRRGDVVTITRVVLHEPSMEVYLRCKLAAGSWPDFVIHSRLFRQYLTPYKHSVGKLSLFPKLYNEDDLNGLAWALDTRGGIYKDHNGLLYLVDGVVYSGVEEQIYISYHPYGQMSKQLICTPDQHAIHYHKRLETTITRVIA